MFVQISREHIQELKVNWLCDVDDWLKLSNSSKFFCLKCMTFVDDVAVLRQSI